MNIMILGAAGFIGTNLTFELAKNSHNTITLVDRVQADFSHIESFCFSNCRIVKENFDENCDFEKLISDQDIIYHLVSTTYPSNANQHIAEEIKANVIVTINLLDACVKKCIKKVVFISSGGTVYGIEKNMPLKEDAPTYPISSYGIQKITIEKLLYLYNYLYKLDYIVIRLANPYGPYQKPNGVLGAVTTFTYKFIMGQTIEVYGDGSVVRDYIYIEDAINGILNIANGTSKKKIFNLGCGRGYSLKEVIETIQKTLGVSNNILYLEGRKADVPVNVLDITRYEEEFGTLNPCSLEEGIEKTAQFMKQQYC
ncbi:MAG: NAD-dependent epimerase/dehydratase family protein [Clostridium sp.]|uniref:NAD-dependent epimerase/dehydratase family protein n=1 Tax=Clostridium sp. TaxID=1506 RepID=UPI003D6D562F